MCSSTVKLLARSCSLPSPSLSPPSPPLSVPPAKRYNDAIDYYSQAIEVNPSVAVYYGNRSFAHLKMESYGYALVDASSALELDRSYTKVCMSQ